MTDDERRRYFRIYDDFRVRYRPAPADADRKPLGEADADVKRLKLLVSKIATVSSDVSEALAIIDRRLMQLEGRLAPADDSAEGVNLSACGLSFVAGEEHRSGELLEVALYLDSASLVISSVARVVGVDSDPARPGKQVVRVDFVRIDPDERELLIQYVLRRQGEQLRHRAIA